MGVVHFQSYLTTLPKLILVKEAKWRNNISISEKQQDADGSDAKN